ncbi:ABC transporter ATP-binding protein [Rhodopila sp.]|jgi:branched-chain amino acid transport system ATP-binding protein|uniref:ABC transporter ATP-binding protein n=1 Tax=Rhodopila sp. TaxID=2480087 RepID=UPI002CC392BF|nr:ABC transporter ATP-binding protein [Rhodopila sp.]HVZ06285.1 ABC transporter ATP-binding protein [Rhodopila sp.]
MRAALEVEKLSVSYGGDPAVSVPHLALPAGTLAGVVGANGAGKSTLVNGLLGWSRGPARASGVVKLDGETLNGLPTYQRVQRGLVLVPEGLAVFGTMLVEENLRSTRPHGPEAERRAFSVDHVFALFPRLAERRANRAASLSGGERQMLAIGRALRLGPKVLLLDEPSIGLAPRLVLTLLLTIRKLADAGLSVLLVEQNVRAAMEVVDHLYLLERGRIIADGPIGAMRDDPRIVEAYLGSTKA